VTGVASGYRCDIPVIAPVAKQRLMDEIAERIRAGPGNNRGPAARGSRGDRDIRRAAAEILAEAGHFAQANGDFERGTSTPELPMVVS
jgi:hypothetical protein